MKHSQIIKTFFKNRSVNLLNTHAGLYRFSLAIFDVFGAIYLIEQGLSFTAVALAWSGSCLIRFIIRPLSLEISQRFGLKASLMGGVVINSGIFAALAQINGVGAWLYFYMFYLALCDIAYWLPYHSYYAAAGDNDARGKQVGTLLGITSLLHVAAPLAGSLIITQGGFNTLYWVATVVMLSSTLPLIFIKKAPLLRSISFKEALKSIDKTGFIMQIGDGIYYTHFFIWTIILFSLVENILAFGGLLTFGTLLTTTLFLLLGYYIDRGKGQLIANIGIALVSAVIILRAVWATTIPEIIFTDILMALALTFYTPSFQVSFYNLAKSSPSTLWFHFFGEGGWDIGAGLTLLVAAGLCATGVPLRYTALLSLAGLLIIHRVLMRFYKRPAVKPAVAHV